jgi:uncharacterized membrane protein HdeD (DUF308 family)
MTDVESTGAPARLSGSSDTYGADPGRGWLLFAGIMLVLIGVLNVIYGIAAIDNSTFYVRDVEFVLADLQTWGWVLLIVGVVQLVAAFGVWQKTEWGRWLGIVCAAGNAAVQFLVLPAHPVWAIMVFFVDIIIVFGLLTYGGRDRYSLAG